MPEAKRPAYGLQICGCLSAQLAKFRTLNAYQLAGHVANFAFWADEVRHGLALIDGYKTRLDAMSRAQKVYVKEHKVVLFDLEEPYITEGVPKLREIPKEELTKARDELCAAWKSFVTRCLKENLLDAGSAEKACVSLGIAWG